MSNSLAPGFLVLNYTFNGLTHRQTLPVVPINPEVGSVPNLQAKTGSAVSAQTFITDWVNLLRPVFSTTVTFNGWEVYSKPTPESDPLLLWGDDFITNNVGTNAGTTRAAAQWCATFRTIGGGLLKIYLMETVYDPNTRVSVRAGLAAPEGPIYTYVLGNSCCIVGRDGTFPAFGRFRTTKTNDALRKKRFNVG